MHPLNVLSFNVRTDSRDDLENRWDLRKHLAIQAIRDLSPDIVGTQEPQPHQVRYLEENLAEYTRLGASRLADPSKGEYSPLHLRTSRFEILESGQFWLSPT